MPRTRINYLVVLVGVLVIGFLATSIVSYITARDSLNERIAGEILPLTSDNIYSEIERDLLRSILISSLMAHDTFLQDWVLDGEQDQAQITRYLEEIQRKYSTTTAFYISDRTLNYYHPAGIIKQIDQDDAADSWYFRARAMRDPYEINIDHDTVDRSRVTIFINYRVVNRAGEFLGITGIGLAVETVTALIESYQRRYGRQIYFINREGDITLHSSDYGEATNLHERPGLGRFALQILTSPSATISYQKPDGAKMYVNSRLVPEFDWYLLVEQSKSEAEQHLLATLIINMLIALLIAAVVIIAVHFTIRGYQKRLEQMAMTDKLTGAANRHMFQVIFNNMTATARRRREPVALMCIDIDSFKEVNDSHGHHAGDKVLQQFSDIVRRNIREADIFCRWGGDEFLVLMANCTRDCATETAGRIRAEIKSRIFQFSGNEHRISISIGIAQYRDGESMESLVQRADDALYESKRQRRNGIQHA